VHRFRKKAPTSQTNDPKVGGGGVDYVYTFGAVVVRRLLKS